MLRKENEAILDRNRADMAIPAHEVLHPFAGATIAVTGKLKYFTRAAIHAEIESLGAKFGRRLSRNTDYLICDETAKSKLAKALQLGVRVLTEDEFLEMTHDQSRYLLEYMRDAASVSHAARTEQADGTVCYFFGNTCIRARESHKKGLIHLEPLSGNQTACGEWAELPVNQVHRYCILLEQQMNQEQGGKP